MYWKRTVVPVVSSFFSHFGLQTLACMKSTCNGPSPMTASRRFVETLVSQVEIYDQVWFVREGDSGNHHSGKATALVQEMCSWLMEHPGCGETFPMDLVEELRREYQLCFDE